MLMSKEREAEKTLPERWSAKARSEVVLRLSIAPATSPVSALASPRLSLMFPRSGSRAAACSRRQNRRGIHSEQVQREKLATLGSFLSRHAGIPPICRARAQNYTCAKAGGEMLRSWPICGAHQ